MTAFLNGYRNRNTLSISSPAVLYSQLYARAIFIGFQIEIKDIISFFK